MNESKVWLYHKTLEPKVFLESKIASAKKDGYITLDDYRKSLSKKKTTKSESKTNEEVK